MKRLIILFAAIAFALVGCWDSIETEQLGIVTLMGIEAGKANEIKVIIQEKPHERQMAGAGGGSSAAPFFVYEGSGKTISEALQKMATDEHHRLYFAHTNVIILDEELASTKGIKPILDFYERNPEIRLSTWLLISPKGQLSKTMSTDVGLNIDSGTILEETINNEKSNSFFNVGSISDVVELLNKAGSELYAAGINISPKSSGDGSSASDKKFNIHETAVFKGEKMLGWLNEEERKGLSWIKGTVKGGVMNISYENREISLRVTNLKTKIKPEISDNETQLSIYLEITSNIIESQDNIDYMDEATIRKVEQAQNDTVIKDINTVINRAKELKSDFLGFGSYFYQSYPALWKEIKGDWYSYFDEIRVDINVNSTIENIGKVYNFINR